MERSYLISLILLITFTQVCSGGITLNSSLQLSEGFYSIAANDQYILVVDNQNFILIDNTPSQNLSIIATIPIPENLHLDPVSYDQLQAIPNSITNFLYVHSETGSRNTLFSTIQLNIEGDTFSISILNTLDISTIYNSTNIVADFISQQTSTKNTWLSIWISGDQLPFPQYIMQINLTSFEYQSIEINADLFTCSAPLFGGFFNEEEEYLLGLWENFGACSTSPVTNTGFFTKIGKNQTPNQYYYSAPMGYYIAVPAAIDPNSGFGFYLLQNYDNYVNTTVINFNFNTWQNSSSFDIKLSNNYFSLNGIFTTNFQSFTLVAGIRGIKGVVVALQWSGNEVQEVSDPSFYLDVPNVIQNIFSTSQFAFVSSNQYANPDDDSVIYRLSVSNN